jgi:hypothetical protein
MPDTLSISRRGAQFHDQFTMLLQLAFDRALARESEVSEHTLSINGMSGRLYRMFINNLVRIVSKPCYLEIGSYTGSTACAAMDKNCLRVVCIDNWSQFGGPKDAFVHHTNIVRTDNTNFQFIESDFRKVNVPDIGRFNIYLFDGPHEERDQYDGLALYDAALEDDFFFIVDDWNWPAVRSGTLKAIRDTGFDINFAIEIRTTQNDQHVEVHGADWHNGYFLSKLSRKQRRFTFT